MQYDQFSSLKNARNLVHGFTHRNGGVSQTAFGSQHMGILSGIEEAAAWENIKALAESFEIKPRALVMTEQVHRSHIAHFSFEEAELTKRDDHALCVLKETDGVFTRDAAVLLLTFYADCTPIYFYDPMQSVIGMVHSGWRGTAQRIAAEGVRFMQKTFASELKDIQVVIGPSASQCCYEVDDYVKDHFTWAAAYFEPTKPGHYKMDLKGINRYILLEAGIGEAQIEVSDHCTLCETKRYFSYRNEQGHTGRMAAFMMQLP